MRSRDQTVVLTTHSMEEAPGVSFFVCFLLACVCVCVCLKGFEFSFFGASGLGSGVKFQEILV